MKCCFTVLALLIATSIGPAASAGVIITATEVGSEVIFDGGGTLNLTDLTPLGSASLTGSINPSDGELVLGDGPLASFEADTYGGQISGPSGFGSGTASMAQGGTGGLRFGTVVASDRLIVVPEGYNSGTVLTGSLTFSDEDFASLGLSPGTYTWTWGSETNADSLTLTVVPEPATVSLILLGCMSIGLSRRRR